MRRELNSSECISKVTIVVYLGCKLLIKGIYFVRYLYDALYNGTQIFFVSSRKII